jgi:hypothetical protein
MVSRALRAAIVLLQCVLTSGIYKKGISVGCTIMGVSGCFVSGMRGKLMHWHNDVNAATAASYSRPRFFRAVFPGQCFFGVG